MASTNNNKHDNDLTDNVSNEFKQMVIDWVNIDNELKLTCTKIKELKTNRKDIEHKILLQMKNIKLDLFEIDNGKIRKNVSKTKGALKHETIQNSLFKIFNDIQKANNVTKAILDDRQVVERIRLKRTYKRQNKT
jgi:hypothetical protein